MPKNTPLAFVDVETTGTDSLHNRVIEIGVIRVEQNQIVDSFSTLVNPELHLSPFISEITGITSKELEKAPRFFDIKDRLLEILDGCVFVAHNARFDYSFIKNEFKRLEIPFKKEVLCTVKLSRSLYPQFYRHNLDSIIKRFNFSCVHRHRAYDDTKVLFDFYNHIQNEFSQKLLKKTFSYLLKQSPLPPYIDSDFANQLPETSGVYIFYGENGSVLYIGKSKNLRERVFSHFRADINSPMEMELKSLTRSIKTIETAGELSAYLLESSLIKSESPLLNKRLRHTDQLFMIRQKENDNGYYCTSIESLVNETLPNESRLISVFRTEKQAKKYLENVGQEYKLCNKLLGLEKSASSCFGYHLGTCLGACVNKEQPLKYNLRFTQAFSAKKIIPWPFSGPIIIEETNPVNNLKEQHLFNNWCFLESASGNDYDWDNYHTIKPPVFDIDIYQILLRYIKNPSNHKHIKKAVNTFQEI